MSSVTYLPPVGIKLPRELRRLVNRLAHRQPDRHAVLERHAPRLLVEYGLDKALAPRVASVNVASAGAGCRVAHGGDAHALHFLHRLVLSAWSRWSA